jgi:adenylate kinase family enzyme
MANLILIGPQGIGKSTVAEWITHLTGRQRVSLDDRDHPYHAIRLPEARERIGRGPFMDQYRSWKTSEIRSVELHLGAVNGHVIDFGAGHSVYEDPLHVKRLSRAVADHHVVLLLPSPSLERSRKILLEQHPHVHAEFVNHVLDNPSNEHIADHVVYREAKSAKEVAQEVLKSIPTWTI